MIFPHLDERQRQPLTAAEARSIGHGGIRLVAQAGTRSTARTPDRSRRSARSPSASGPGLGPGGVEPRFPVGQQVDRPTAVQIDQDRAVDMSSHPRTFQLVWVARCR
ncbi:hypothetical protein BCD48_02475 [Pseudofrankia sp. BMG5.36]|nr:hypothetical protein BCD48_02475 [Pseudofrankia sp. BMG5.36]